METREVLNNLLVLLFNRILNIEEKVLKNGEFSDLSIASMHTIDAVGKGSAKSMAVIANDLGITPGTLSISVDVLVKKGYIERQRSDEDRRVVYLSLTEKGMKAYDSHKEFHNQMISYAVESLDEKEEKILVRSLAKITDYFEAQYK